jgi:hypothetical protein
MLDDGGAFITRPPNPSTHPALPTPAPPPRPRPRPRPLPPGRRYALMLDDAGAFITRAADHQRPRPTGATAARNRGLAARGWAPLSVLLARWQVRAARGVARAARASARRGCTFRLGSLRPARRSPINLPLASAPLPNPL